jgi:hypothetical protein
VPDRLARAPFHGAPRSVEDSPIARDLAIWACAVEASWHAASGRSDKRVAVSANSERLSERSELSELLARAQRAEKIAPAIGLTAGSRRRSCLGRDHRPCDKRIAARGRRPRRRRRRLRSSRPRPGPCRLRRRDADMVDEIAGPGPRRVIDDRRGDLPDRSCQSAAQAASRKLHVKRAGQRELARARGVRTNSAVVRRSGVDPVLENDVCGAKSTSRCSEIAIPNPTLPRCDTPGGAMS